MSPQSMLNVALGATMYVRPCGRGGVLASLKRRERNVKSAKRPRAFRKGAVPSKLVIKEHPRFKQLRLPLMDKWLYNNVLKTRLKAVKRWNVKKLGRVLVLMQVLRLALYAAAGQVANPWIILPIELLQGHEGIVFVNRIKDPTPVACSFA
eukprot:1156190-Pelagomonas_calceolata.AAC.4